MKSAWTFGLGIIARILGVILAHYADWMMHKVAEGADVGRGFVADLGKFARRVLRVFAGQMCGRSIRRYEDCEEQERYEPSLFGN